MSAPESFEWATASKKARADTVRSHYASCFGSEEKLCELFDLKKDGLRKILQGGDWQPEYIRPSPRREG